MFLRRLISIALLSGFATASSAAVTDITCEEIGAAIGSHLTAMTPDPSSEPGWIDNPDAYQIICSWVTQPALKMMQGSPLDGAELQDVGQVSVQLFAHKDASKVSELRSGAPVYPLPFKSTAPDIWVFAFGGLPDYSEHVGLLPPELYVGEVSTSISAMPLLPGMPTSFAPLTKGWSIEAGMRVIEMAAGHIR